MDFERSSTSFYANPIALAHIGQFSEKPVEGLLLSRETAFIFLVSSFEPSDN